jgi:hypothetical protein
MKLSLIFYACRPPSKEIYDNVREKTDNFFFITKPLRTILEKNISKSQWEILLTYSFLKFIPSICQFCFCFSREKNKNIINFFCISGLPTSCILSPSYHSGNCMLYLNKWSVNNEYACRSLVLLLGVRNFNLFLLLSIAV